MVCLFQWHSFDACMKIHDVLAKTGLFLLTLREGGRTPPPLFLNPYKQLEVYEKTSSLNLLLSVGVFFLSDSSWTSGSLVWLRFRFSMLSISWRTSSTVLCLPKGKHQNLSYNMYFSRFIIQYNVLYQIPTMLYSYKTYEFNSWRALWFGNCHKIFFKNSVKLNTVYRVYFRSL